MIAGSRRASLVLTVLALALTSCSASAIKVNGKILKNGSPMVVSEDTYVTLSFILDSKKAEKESQSHSAKFDQKTGTYTVELPSGQYRIMLIIAPPAKKDGKPSGPPKPIKFEKVYDLTKNQELDLEVPANK